MTARYTPASVLPHRPPLLLVDRLLRWSATGLEAEADVGADNPFAEPGRGVPRWLAIEYLAQAAGILDGIRLREAGLPVTPGYLLGTRLLDAIDGWFTPGQCLRLRVEELVQDASGLGAYAAELDDGSRRIQCRMTVYRPPADSPRGDG